MHSPTPPYKKNNLALMYPCHCHCLVPASSSSFACWFSSRVFFVLVHSSYLPWPLGHCIIRRSVRQLLHRPLLRELLQVRQRRFSWCYTWHVFAGRHCEKPFVASKEICWCSVAVKSFNILHCCTADNKDSIAKVIWRIASLNRAAEYWSVTDI